GSHPAVPGRPTRRASDLGEGEITAREMAVAIILAVGMTVLLFIALPLFIRQVIAGYLPGLFWRNLSEGLVRALILVGYILAVSRSEEHTSELQSRENLVC